MQLLIKNIKALGGILESDVEWLKGSQMSDWKLIENAFLLIENDQIHSFGRMEDCTSVENANTIDASNRYCIPAWCDSHTHLVFAGTRESEFVDRINGLSYEEIAARGGGILNSAKRLENASEDELLEAVSKRANEIIKTGTGAVEIKSGYGLSTKAELKILRVAQKLKQISPLTIKTTFLGAHAIPAAFKANRRGYIDLILNEMIPQIAEEKLADYIDVFCEENYFSVDEMTEIIEAGKQYGMIPKVHVNQFNAIGGIKAAVDANARSVDHLEELSDDDIEALQGAETIATLLPSCSFFIQIPFAPARRLIQNNLAVALASDYNPGSTPSGNIPFVLSLACIKMKMKPEEAFNAVTINGAYAMHLSNTHGSITKGKKANLILTQKIPSINYIPYAFGGDHIYQTILNGKISYTNG